MTNDPVAIPFSMVSEILLIKMSNNYNVDNCIMKQKLMIERAFLILRWFGSMYLKQLCTFSIIIIIILIVI